MYLFSVEIEQRRTRRVTVPAPSAEAAKIGARVLLRPNDRIVGVDRALSDIDPKTEADVASDIVAAILDKEVPGPRGLGMTVTEWIDRLKAEERPLRNDADLALARCGLRFDAGDLHIGSPGVIPALAIWFNGTAYCGPQLHATLRRLPGAKPSVRTFAGIRSRSVGVPLKAAVPHAA